MCFTCCRLNQSFLKWNNTRELKGFKGQKVIITGEEVGDQIRTERDYRSLHVSKSILFVAPKMQPRGLATIKGKIRLKSFVFSKNKYLTDKLHLINIYFLLPNMNNLSPPSWKHSVIQLLKIIIIFLYFVLFTIHGLVSFISIL